MKKILLYNTSIGSENLGDQIIMDYCHHIMRDLLPNTFFLETVTQDRIGKRTYAMNRTADYRVVCGTNLLRPDMFRKRQWKIGPGDIKNLQDICLMGVGWNNYQQERIGYYTKYLYKSILSNTYLHSVRDKYTEERIRSMGINNVIYTACPTMWKLDEALCKEIPEEKAENVITTVTNYRKSKDLDNHLLSTLCKEYKMVYLWPQCYKDIEYLKSFFDTSKLEILPPSLEALDNLLADGISLDYVGTRLHGGIRALNHKRRSIIIGVDNRANEIARDTNINVLPRGEQKEKLVRLINCKFSTDITLPYANIEKWKSQFSET